MLEHVRAKEIAISERVDGRNDVRRKMSHCQNEPADPRPYAKCDEITGQGSALRSREPPGSTSRRKIEIAVCSLDARQDVNDRQDKNPDDIDKVPVKPDGIERRPGLL